MCFKMSQTTTTDASSIKLQHIEEQQQQKRQQLQQQHKHKQHKRWPQSLHLINFYLKEEFYKHQSRTLSLNNTLQQRQQNHHQHNRKNYLQQQQQQQHNRAEEQIQEQQQQQCKRQQHNSYYCHNKGKSRKELTGNGDILLLSLSSFIHRKVYIHPYSTALMILFALLLVHLLPRTSCAISPETMNENYVLMPEVALKPSFQHTHSNSSINHSNESVTRWRRSPESINPLYGNLASSIRQTDNMASVYYGGGGGSTNIVSSGNHFITSNQHGVLYSVDNRKPAFKNCAGYKPSVKEEQPENTYVIMVEAEDPDPDQEIKYSLVQSAAERPKFRINSSTGVIVTEHTFDRDEPIHEKAVYVTVQATDNGRPPLDDVCTFKVTIEDINDNPPVFDKARYDESMSEDIQVYKSIHFEI